MHKRPTQMDVARRAGVSRATVSYVLNGAKAARVPISQETNQRVMHAIAELGYVPDANAQALRSGSTKTIGLIIPDMHNPHFWQHADGVEQETVASGFRLLLSSMNLSPYQGEDVFEDLSRQRIDGLILTGSFIKHSAKAQQILKQILARRLAVVEITEHSDVDNKIDRVVADYRVATMEMMAHLLALGHQRIGLIYGVHPPLLAQDRLDPYTASLRAAGLPAESTLIAQCGPNIEDGYQGALQLLHLTPRPTALIAVNDLLAIGALRAAQDLNLRVPHDVSLVGYDDTPVSRYLVPRLTTASKNAVAIGREAVRLLLARIQKPDRPLQTRVFSSQVILRESTGPASV